MPQKHSALEALHIVRSITLENFKWESDIEQTEGGTTKKGKKQHKSDC